MEVEISVKVIYNIVAQGAAKCRLSVFENIEKILKNATMRPIVELRCVVCLLEG